MKYPIKAYWHKLLTKLAQISYPTLRILDKQYKIPLIIGLGYNHLKPQEEWKLTLISSIIKKFNGSFWDVGVNIGQTLLQLKAIDSSIPYVGFEPNPFCVAYTLQLIHLNQIPDCKVLPVACANNTGLMPIFINSKDMGDSAGTLIPNFRESQQAVKGLLTPSMEVEPLLKQEFANHSVSLVKVDVEGAEADVIKALMPLLQQQHPIIICEVLPVYSPENTQRLNRQKQLENCLGGMDYYIFRVKKENDTFHSLEPLEQIGIHSDLDLCDYVFVPSNKWEKFQTLFDFS